MFPFTVEPILKPMWEMTKLERATNIAIASETVSQVSWSSQWPHGHCFVCSLLLAPAIRMPLRWKVKVAVGVAFGGRPHAWVQTPGGDRIDPTYGMFDFGPALRVVPAKSISSLGHVGKRILTLEEEEFCRNAALSPTRRSGWCKSSGITELFADPKAWQMPTAVR